MSYQENYANWFRYCFEGNVAGVKGLLAGGFHPDTRDDKEQSGLWWACASIASAVDKQTVIDKQTIIETLITALQTQYKEFPVKLYTALTAGGGGDGLSPYGALDMPADNEAGRKLINAVKAVEKRVDEIKIQNLDPDIWFQSCSGKNADQVRMLEKYLQAGFDPDARDGYDRNGLGLALKAEGAPFRKEIVDTLIQALTQKYHYDFPVLVDALKNALDTVIYPFVRKDDPEIEKVEETRQKFQKLIDANVALPVAPGSAQAVSRPAVLVAAAKEPMLDNTLTTAILQEVLPNGKTHLQELAGQGRLAEVFTPKIWAGRVDELEATWALVPEKDRAQVPDIGRTRIKARFTSARERETAR